MHGDNMSHPLLSHIRRVVEVLKSQSRDSVLFINISEISRRSNLTHVTTKEILRLLEEKGIITYIKENICLLSKDINIFDLKLFEKDMTYGLVEKSLSYIANNNPCTIGQFMRESGMSGPSYIRIINALEESDIITRIRAGKVKYIFIKNKELFLQLCKFFGIEVSKVMTLDEFVKTYIYSESESESSESSINSQEK